ncbi:MAG: hypothetical protein JST68_12155 [Bacteroidetes bacterium]|nr:hypothetical protein [Bacteroidota bacterium]
MKKNLLAAGLGMIAVWIVFKCFYPYADFFSDSYSYIQAAAQRDAIGYRPIGYSIFLRMVHVVSKSDTFLVTLQYVLVQGASLVFLYKLWHWFPVSMWVQRVSLAFVVLNPVMPYTCNYVSSDALFIAMSLFWLSLLMSVVIRPAWWKLWAQLVLLVCIFNTRYVALYYPAAAAIAFFWSKKDWVFKSVGVVTSVLVLFIATSWVKAITKKETGAAIFSAFSGWQIASNALHIYPYLPVDTVGLPSAESRLLAGYVKDYFDREGPVVRKRGLVATTDYMWIRSLPLHRYMADYRQRDSLSYFTAWNRVGVVFNEYGYHLVKKHPVAFGRYYLWPSAKSFFYTPLDVYAIYNEGKMYVDSEAVSWFAYSGTRVKVRSATIQGLLLAYFPLLYLLLNVAFVVTAFLFLPVRGLRERYPVFTVCFRLVASYLLANAAFCIFASPTVFRYQVLPVLLLFTFALYGIHFVTCWHGDKSFTLKRRS